MESNDEWTDGMTRTQIKSLEAYLSDLKNQTDEMERQVEGTGRQGRPRCSSISRPRPTARRSAASRHPKKPGRSKPEQHHDRGIQAVRGQLNELKLDLAAGPGLAGERRNAAANKVTAGVEPRRGRYWIETSLTPVPGPARGRRPWARRYGGEGQTRGSPADRQESERPGGGGRPQRKLDTLEQEYKKLWAEKSRAIREEIELAMAGGKGQNLDQEVRDAALQVEQLKTKQATLTQHSATLEVMTGKHATDQVDIALMLDKRSILQGMQEAVNRRLEQLKFEAKGETRSPDRTRRCRRAGRSPTSG